MDYRIIARTKVKKLDYNVIIRYVKNSNHPFKVEREWKIGEKAKTEEINCFDGLSKAFKCFEYVSGRKFNSAFKAMFYVAFFKNKL